MRKKNLLRRLIFLPLFAITLGLLTDVDAGIFANKEVKDNTVYDSNEVVSLNDFEKPSNAAENVEVNKVTIHYHNDDNKCEGRAFYVWNTGSGNGKEFNPDTVSPTDMAITLDFTQGEFFQTFLGKKAMMFIIKFKRTATSANWDGQSEDIELKYEKYAEYIKDGHLEIWTIPSGNSVEIYGSEAETKFDRIVSAEFTSWNTIKCEATAIPSTYSVYAYDSNYYMLDAKKQTENKYLYSICSGKPTGDVFEIQLNYFAHLNLTYVVESVYNSRPMSPSYATVAFDKLYRTERFEQYFTTTESLGVEYTSSKTTFKLWAPTTALAEVRLYETGTTSDIEGGNDDYVSHRMNYTKGGIWTLEVVGDLKNKYYTYNVQNTLGENEVMDPYATACGINGKRGMIYDKAETNPDGWNEVPQVWDGVEGYDIKTPQELSIYEMHVRDFTIHESWVSNHGNANGTYNAFAESGTTITQDGKTVSTGYDHIDELGVRAIQLLPVFDHDNNEEWTDGKPAEFNWGYNPLNYNCVEGQYSSDPEDGLVRIKEYKNLIMQLSKTEVHTRTIMDVVYNHVSSASSSCFNKIMPKYFFRYKEDGGYSNGSGCANDFRTESTMGRKFIVDSVVMWAKEYKVKGFRFDLMILIDSQTMKDVQKALYEIDPDIYIYGEAWDNMASSTVIDAPYSATTTSSVYQEMYVGEGGVGLEACHLGVFNDETRNAFRGGNGWGADKTPEWGFISQGNDVGDKAGSVGYALSGQRSNGGNPKQNITFASCHDNFTLFDTLVYNLGATPGKGTKPSIEAVARASSALHMAVMMTNGVAFMHGGEEIMRSKIVSEEHREAYPDKSTVLYGENVSHDSYNAPDETNQIIWNRKISIDGFDMSEIQKAFKDAIRSRNNSTFFDYDYISSHGGLDHTSTGGTSTGGHENDGKYGIYINDTRYEGAYNPAPMDNSFTEYAVIGAYAEVGDILQAYDRDNEARWDIPKLDPYSSGWKMEDGKIICTENGYYDFYLKFKYQDDMVYIGRSAKPGGVAGDGDLYYKNAYTGSSLLVFTRGNLVLFFSGRNGGSFEDELVSQGTIIACNDLANVTIFGNKITVKPHSTVIMSI